jgi:gamma-glutamyltranspeptidase/glutathione hydrolase
MRAPRTCRTCAGIAAAVALAAAAPVNNRPEGRMLATRSVIHARHGMVASAHPLATQIGIDVLKAGGNAVDAAIAVNAALGFLEPVSCGVGGDLFAILWDAKSSKIHALNASGRAPRGVHREAIPPEPDGAIPPSSPHAWTVPGAVDGWFMLHERFGRLPMQRLLAPAIRAAEEGEPVPQVIAAAWELGAARHGDKPGFAATFLPGGRAPREGEIFRNPGLARTYKLIAEGGRDAFYKGAVADAVDAFSRKVGGALRKEDLAAHRSEWVEPVSTAYRGAALWELPPNGQGITALEMANIVERFDLRAMGRASPDFWHVMIEAKKLAFEDRARFIADPAFAKVPVASLVSKEYARDRAGRIDMARAARQIAPGDPRFAAGDTTILAAADGEGNMIALIQSNYSGFGSGYAVEGFGFGLHNRGSQFDLRPGRANTIEPGKRPFHTIIPALVTRGGKPWIAYGVMGGDMQPQGHVQVLVNLVDFGMNLQEAGDAPRFYHTESSDPDGSVMKDGGRLALEPGVPEEVRRELLRRGHRIEDAPAPAFGGYQAVARDPATGVLSGASESRKDGCAIGY